MYDPADEFHLVLGAESLPCRVVGRNHRIHNLGDLLLSVARIEGLADYVGRCRRVGLRRSAGVSPVLVILSVLAVRKSPEPPAYPPAMGRAGGRGARDVRRRPSHEAMTLVGCDQEEYCLHFSFSHRITCHICMMAILQGFNQISRSAISSKLSRTFYHRGFGYFF